MRRVQDTGNGWSVGAGCSFQSYSTFSTYSLIYILFPILQGLKRPLMARMSQKLPPALTDQALQVSQTLIISLLNIIQQTLDILNMIEHLNFGHNEFLRYMRRHLSLARSFVKGQKTPFQRHSSVNRRVKLKKLAMILLCLEESSQPEPKIARNTRKQFILDSSLGRRLSVSLFVDFIFPVFLQTRFCANLTSKIELSFEIQHFPSCPILDSLTLKHILIIFFCTLLKP